mmetsp:Transcript_7639/g.15953  ORF Transcript_7639/g.15953 Transcript_7639/m.15953 type:complete len:219 (+) Transcript_7639:33-689(+)
MRLSGGSTQGKPMSAREGKALPFIIPDHLLGELLWQHLARDFPRGSGRKGVSPCSTAPRSVKERSVELQVSSAVNAPERVRHTTALARKTILLRRWGQRGRRLEVVLLRRHQVEGARAIPRLGELLRLEEAVFEDDVHREDHEPRLAAAYREVQHRGEVLLRREGRIRDEDVKAGRIDAAPYNLVEVLVLIVDLLKTQLPKPPLRPPLAIVWVVDPHL